MATIGKTGLGMRTHADALCGVMGQVGILGSNGHLEEGCRAMGDDAVTLHLPKPQATVPGTPLHRLSCQDLHREVISLSNCG